MLLLALLVACGRAAPEPSSPMARDQLFFVGHDPDPLLLALVFQRHRAAPGASLEAKAFAAWKGEWVTPFWERVEVAAWPGAQREQNQNGRTALAGSTAVCSGAPPVSRGLAGANWWT